MWWNALQMLYGTVEVRGKLCGTGVHTAFWMFDARQRQEVYQCAGNALPGSFANEIDIVETCPVSYGNLTTVRQNTFSPTGQDLLTTTTTDVSLNFHTYKIVWTPTNVTFFIDGVQTNQTTTNIPSGPMFFICDIELADGCSGDVSSGNFPTSNVIDYVKAWDSNNNVIFFDDFTGAPATVVQGSSNLVFNQQNNNVTAVVGTSATIAYTSGTLSLSYLLLAVQVTNLTGTTTGVTDSLGNTWSKVVTNESLGTAKFEIWHVPVNKNGGGTNTITVHCTSGPGFSLNLIAAEYTGQIQPGNPVDTNTALTQQNSPTATYGPVTTTLPYDGLVWIGYSAVVAWTPGAGFTARLNGNNAQGAVLMDSATKATVPGSYSFTATAASSGLFGALLAIKSTLEPAPIPTRGTRSK
jgi:hypothetical protein